MKPLIHKSSQGGARKLNLRRERVIPLLEEDLKTKKYRRQGKRTDTDIPEPQLKRIEKELTTLKSRV